MSEDQTIRDVVGKAMCELLERRFPDEEERKRFDVSIGSVFSDKTVVRVPVTRKLRTVSGCKGSRNAVCAAQYLRYGSEPIDIVYELYKRDGRWFVSDWHFDTDRDIT